MSILDKVDKKNIYTNIQDISTINLIKKNLIDQTGIYCILNNLDNKVYIGSSMNLAKRVLQHIKNTQSNVYLQNAINKYKLENFSLYILEFCSDKDLTNIELNVKLIVLEQKYLDIFDNKYNINPTAGKSRFGAKHSEATKELFKKIRQNNPNFLNKTHSTETIEKMKLRLTGSNNHMFGKPVTEENKKLISKMFSKSIYLYDANTLKLINKYDKHKDLLEDLKVSSKTLVKYKDSGKIFRDKYILTTSLINE
nr:GIY-YIG endonuclease [Cordyceps militaris]